MMTGTVLLGIFETIGSVVGIIITLVTFWGIISKRPIEALKRMIREESKVAHQEYYENVQKILDRADRCDNTMMILLRHDIINTYEKYKDKKSFPIHVKQDVMGLVQEYQAWNGNSFALSLAKEMETWETE